MTPQAAAHARLVVDEMFDALGDGVLIRDHDGVPTLANRAARALLGADLAAAALLPAHPCDGTEVCLRRPGRAAAWIAVTVRDQPEGGQFVVLTDHTDRQRLQALTAGHHALTRIMADRSSIVAAGPALVEALGSLLEAELETPWHAGALWLVEGSALSCVSRWDAEPTEPVSALATGVPLVRGEGLPGHVWATGEPACHTDLPTQGAPQRRAAFAAAGLHTGLAIPIVAEGRTLGVLELLSREVMPAIDLGAVDLVIGEQLGEWVRRREAEEHLAHTATQLEDRNEELERSNAELEQFAYVASHDLSEPLRMVSSYVQLLQRRYAGQLGSDADEFIGYAVDGAARMRSLIDDLLVYSRVGRTDRACVPVDLAGTVAGTLRGLATAIAAQNAEIEVAPALPTVVGDATMLGQLFQNLIANALKFTAGETPRVRVDARRGTSEWEFAVADNGIGIDPEHADRIFKMFQRLHRRDQYEGTGIGLAVCRKIVDRHGGRIWTEPNPGGGSIFRFTLPEHAAMEASS